ncbi:MAG: hypothetical protein ACKORJ_08655, partial [Bacteroidota bacterium]
GTKVSKKQQYPNACPHLIFHSVNCLMTKDWLESYDPKTHGQARQALRTTLPEHCSAPSGFIR